MNPTTYLSSLLLVCVPATTGLGTLALGTTALSLAIPTISVTSTASLGTTLAALGLAKIGTATLLALNRQRRQAEEVETNLIKQEILFQAVSKLEEAKCVRRFLCEVSTGKLDARDYLDTVKPLLAQSLESVLDSAKFPYSEAVKSGARHNSLEKCQFKYSCPKTGAEIYQALALYGA
jgi:hypothetical protein